MDGVGAGALGDREDRGRRKVGVRAEAVGLIRELDVATLPIGLGVDGHRLDPELLAGPDDADSNLTAIGDQHFRKHGRSFWCEREGAQSAPTQEGGPRACCHDSRID
ncbi:hypothetical protein D3C86_1447120 [compost metagenome]